MQTVSTEPSIADREKRLSRPPVPRSLLLLLLLALLTVCVWFLFATERGRTIREDPRQAKQDVTALVQRHPIAAPAIFLSVYAITTLVCLPVWWLQVLSGFGFGLVGGIFWSLIGSTIGATAASLSARWLAADWFHQHVEARMHRLRAIDRKLDRNGLLVVIVVRLIHGMPFGLSNYAFGIIGIPLTDIAAGTFLGSIPAQTLIVTLGVDHRRVMTWQFITLQALMHLALLIPIILLYRRRPIEEPASTTDVVVLPPQSQVSSDRTNDK